MRHFLFALLLLALPLRLFAATAGDKIEVITGTTPNINWQTQPIKTWTLSGNSTPTQSNVPASTTQRTALEVKVVQPAGQSYSIATPAGWIWLTTDWSSLPTDSTNRIVLEKIATGVFATWVEAPDPIWENASGVIQVQTAQSPQLFFLQSAAPDDPSSVSLLVDTQDPWTAGSIAEFRNDGTLAGRIASVSGYTGAGTLYLSDDGTYKPATGGSNLWAYSLGLLYPDPAVGLIALDSQLADASTNVALLVTSVNTWTGGELIKAVNNSDTMFSVSGVSGYTGAGTLFLSDDGTYKAASGGDTIWDNTAGVISPLGTGQVTNILSFTSGLADNATNVALVVDTANLWTSQGASQIVIRNASTNAITLSDYATDTRITASGNLPAEVNNFNSATIRVDKVNHAASASGDVGVTGADNGNWVLSALLNSALLDLFATTNNYTDYWQVRLIADPSNPELLFYDNTTARNILDFQPGITSTGSAAAYLLDTSNVLTNGDKLVSIANAGSEFAYFGAEKTFVLNDGPSDYFDLRASSTDGPHMIMWAAGNPAVELFPDVASDYTPFNFQAIQNLTANTSPLFAIGQFGTNQFTLKANSGYTDSGTKVLYDDGTYKAFSNGTNTVVQQIGPGTLGYVPKWIGTNQLGDSIEFQNGSTNITIAGTFGLGTSTNIFGRLSADTIFYQSGTNPNIKVQDGAGNGILFGITGGNIGILSSTGDLELLANGHGLVASSIADTVRPNVAGTQLGTTTHSFGNLLMSGSLTVNGSTNSVGIYSGFGSPEGVQTASPGSMWIDYGGTNQIKRTGTGNTGWKEILTL